MVQASVEIDPKDEIARVVGKDNVETIVSRDPTLEEAYLSIFR